jgi:enediyne biosynthesis protein E4
VRVLVAGVGAIVVIAVVVGVTVLSRPAGAAAAAKPAPRLVEEAAAAGLVHVYDGGFEFYVGGGVAAFDCNADSLPELYLAGGTAPAGLFANTSAAGGALGFQQLPSTVTDLVAVTGAYPLDVDSDGIGDLAVLRRGENVLLRGLGDCQFERANERWGFDGGTEWSTAFSARWDSGATFPTLAIGNYVNEASEDASRLCFDNELFTSRPGADGYGPAVALSPGWCALSMLFSDWDRSGRRDLRVSNDRHYYGDYSAGEEQLWRIEADAPPHAYGRDDGWQRLRVFGMGIASQDVTGDGFPDYFLTSQSDNKLQTLADGPAQPRFSDIALRRGAIVHRPYEGDTNRPSTAWHDEFDDVNNDGYIDLFVAKGNVEAQPDYADRDPSNLLLGQSDGSFVEGAVEAGLLDYGKARGGAVIDLNVDGMLDLVVVDRVENVRLYRNVGSGTAEQPAAMGNWISVDVSQPGPNANAIGAWVEARVGTRTDLRELTVGGGHVSGSLGPVHFGLADAPSAEVRVTWPDGRVGPWQSVAANRHVTITPTGLVPDPPR